MSAFPSLPLFTDAFIADTGHLSATETGAYIMLLMVAWRSPDCRLPDDDLKLARWARVDARQWGRIKPSVMEFWTLADGFWTQKRLSSERDKVSKFAEVARRNGAHGGRPKSLKNNDGENPKGSVDETQSKAPNPNPNPIPSETSSLRDRARERASTASPNPGNGQHTPPVEASARAPPQSRASRVPADLTLTPEMIATARQEGLPDERIPREFQRFHDHWLAASGANARKHDWSGAAWRNWVRKAVDGFGSPHGSGPGGQRSADDGRIAAARRAAARFPREADVSE